jgi:hypothetical protein
MVMATASLASFFFARIRAMCSLALALLWSALWRFAIAVIVSVVVSSVEANSPSLSSMLTVSAMVVAVLGWWHPPLATSTSSTINALVGRLLSSRRFSIDSVVAIGCGEGAIRLDGSRQARRCTMDLAGGGSGESTREITSQTVADSLS